VVQTLPCGGAHRPGNGDRACDWIHLVSSNVPVRQLRCGHPRDGRARHLGAGSLMADDRRAWPRATSCVRPATRGRHDLVGLHGRADE
jgi:hypothetical protein